MDLTIWSQCTRIIRCSDSNSQTYLVEEVLPLRPFPFKPKKGGFFRDFFREAGSKGDREGQSNCTGDPHDLAKSRRSCGSECDVLCAKSRGEMEGECSMNILNGNWVGRSMAEASLLAWNALSLIDGKGGVSQLE